MSVETATSVNTNNESSTHESWTEKWDIEPHGFVNDVDERFFNEDAPHKPPLIDVELKLAADVQIRDDNELVQSVADYWFPHDSERHTEVAEIVFNDISVWYLPLAPWEKDYESTRIKIVDDFIPDIVQWKAITENENPKEALEEWKEWDKDDDEYEWVELMSETEMEGEIRKWFNEHADWLPYIAKKVKSQANDVEFDDSGDLDWRDSW